MEIALSDWVQVCEFTVCVFLETRTKFDKKKNFTESPLTSFFPRIQPNFMVFINNGISQTHQDQEIWLKALEKACKRALSYDFIVKLLFPISRTIFMVRVKCFFEVLLISIILSTDTSFPED